MYDNKAYEKAGRRKSHRRLENPTGIWEPSVLDLCIMSARLNNGYIQVKLVTREFILRGIIKGNLENLSNAYDNVLGKVLDSKLFRPVKPKGLGIYYLKCYGQAACDYEMGRILITK